ncbi:MAG: tRNA (adenosine(37)-N6)-threonylcarbamoyltransferase complex transferase subunit TsaD [Bacteroidota bacterium]|nr:tRNA (adenosine(37)-N6)-threonylcarbamoyltransferase complex transferase subunit TsaD [Bacteroidota bacterium]MDX5431436.1 tRNA (adenosine(37)-N6)-threonylcarbamoyltransferase complex transferase subunit TsaD [Bacteroidota bacterium]MDX5470164.1 tRNA (adenosine(37)-N6)-threonylcarbamoyltransferase complex transferase subunit TsaD [Bacteroidota bacterium]
MNNVKLLAIESSCDDTSAAVLVDGKVWSNEVANQLVHEKFGGVVPELASRAHQQHIVPVVDAALKKAGIEAKELDLIAYTQGPGLLGSLLVGSSFAKGLSIANGIPLIGVHHMDAHVMAHFIDDPKPAFPFLCLVVSGGHTQLVLMKDHHQMEIIGKTKDDAAGEAFDKSAKLLGLPYPGGPLIDRYAKEGDPNRFTFSTSKMPGYDFSFSGLKTSILYFVQEEKAKNEQFVEENLNDLCASIQSTIVRYLLNHLEKAAVDLGVQNIGIAGGVSANSSLRESLKNLCERRAWNSFIPDFAYCTDNAAMIGISAHYRFLAGERGTMADRPFARS